MARARNIKPGFFLNPELAECSPHARLLYIGLWCLSDKEGRLEDRPKHIKVQIFPSEMVDVDALLEELSVREFIIRYECSGNFVICIPKFLKHQNPHRNEVDSILPCFEPKTCKLYPRRERSDQNVSAPAESISISISPILNPECGKQESAVAPRIQKPMKAKKDVKPKTRLGEFLESGGGQPPIEWGEWAYREFGWDGNRLAFEWDAFATDFWLTDNCLKYDGGRKADWFATWRNHCRDKASQRNRGNGAGGKPSSGFAAAFAASVAARYGISRAGGGFGGGRGAQGAGEDARASTDRLPIGEIPY